VHARDTVVVSRDESHDIVAYHGVFVAVHVVDARDVQADAGEDGLPARDGMCADDGVVRGELVADILGRAARRHDRVAARCGGGLEDWLGAVRRQGFEVGAEGGGHAVIAGVESDRDGMRE